MNVKSTVILCLLLSSFAAGAQITDQQINAFSASYTAESAREYDKAIGILKAVYNEGSYETNLRLGWLCYQKKDYPQSITYYKQALKVKPASIEALFGMVNPGAAALNWAEVFTAYQKILALDGDNSVANYRIALMYYYRKEFATAEKHLQKVIDRYPFDYDIVLLMAQVKLALGKTGESKGYYQRALLYSPSNSAIKEMLNKL